MFSHHECCHTSYMMKMGRIDGVISHEEPLDDECFAQTNYFKR